MLLKCFHIRVVFVRKETMNFFFMHVRLHKMLFYLAVVTCNIDIDEGNSTYSSDNLNFNFINYHITIDNLCSHKTLI